MLNNVVLQKIVIKFSWYDRDERDLEAGKSANNKDEAKSKEKEGGVGKLKLSSGMKEKLEAAMGGSRKSSIRSKSDAESEKGDTDVSIYF